VFQVCPGCERFIEEFDSDVQSGVIRCAECRTKQRFRFRPLQVLFGASGSGKSTVARELVGGTPGTLVLDQDILWSPAFDTPEDGYARFRDTWLRLAANIHQGEMDTLLVGSGVPAQFESRPGMVLFSAARYAALVCSPDVLGDRLRERPPWRGSSKEEFIDQMVAYNEWLISEGPNQSPPVALLDTSSASISESAAQVAGWLSGKI